jgi:hypothetical protein
MPDNMRVWNQVKATDPRATKKFKKGGGFSGTAINPIYLARRATEVFGPVGIGWGHEEIESKVVDGAVCPSGTEKIWFTHVKLWFVLDGQRGEVSQWGATMFVERFKKNTPEEYWSSDEEAAKKSRTDALSKCLSMLGFSADIWEGLYDDPKYVEERKAEEGKRAVQKSHENRVKTLDNMLTRYGMCENDQDKTDVVRWLIVNEFGRPKYADILEVREKDGAAAELLDAIREKEGPPHNIKLPLMLEAARAAKG